MSKYEIYLSWEHNILKVSAQNFWTLLKHSKNFSVWLILRENGWRWRWDPARWYSFAYSLEMVWSARSSNWRTPSYIQSHYIQHHHAEARYLASVMVLGPVVQFFLTTGQIAIKKRLQIKLSVHKSLVLEITSSWEEISRRHCPHVQSWSFNRHFSFLATCSDFRNELKIRGHRAFEENQLQTSLHHRPSASWWHDPTRGRMYTYVCMFNMHALRGYFYHLLRWWKIRWRDETAFTSIYLQSSLQHYILLRIINMKSIPVMNQYVLLDIFLMRTLHLCISQIFTNLF